jgi:hypothetical protein
MRIVRETPDLLVVAESAAGLRVCGAVLGATGAGLVAIGWQAGSVPGWIAGACILLVGAMFAILPATSRFSFNRSEKRLVVTRRHIWTRGSSGVEEFPLNDIVAVRAEKARFTTDDENTWRIVVELSSGRAIPFESYYTSGYTPKAEMAARIASFVGAGTNARDPLGGSPYAIKPESRGVALLIAFAVAIVGAAFGAFGVVSLTREYERLSTWLPVPATVLSKRVDIRVDSEGDTYRPEVVYRYSVNDRPYTSRNALPLNESRSGTWAHRVIAPFAVGGTYTAWYDPANPSHAFIVRSHSIIAPVFTAIGLIVTLSGCVAIVAVLRTPR